MKTPEQDIYDEYYYKFACEGHNEFLSTQGKALSPWMDYVLKLANLKSGERVLDLGTGRGEIALHAANRGCLSIGLDYASASINIANKLRENSDFSQEPFTLIQSDARYLPFMPLSLDVILMLDIVEHLSQTDLLNVLRQTYEVLSPDGRLIVHTMPNFNYYKWAYPVYRTILGIFGKKLPKDPRLRVYHGECHVNIQTPGTLKTNLQLAGFNNVKIKLTQLGGSTLKKLICRTFPLKYVLANDIIAVARK